MLLQTLAKGIAVHVADAAPPFAAVRMDMQSVVMEGVVGLTASACSIAQSSAAAAVEIREGGDPNP